MFNSISSGVSSMMPNASFQRPEMNSEAMAEELVAAADSDGDGAISEAEFSAFHENRGDSSEIQSLFEQMDESGDGTLSSSEISETLQQLEQQFREMNMSQNEGSQKPMGPPPGPPDVSELFSSSDTDGSDTLSFEEFSQSIQSPDGQDNTQRLEEMFAQADSNEDGELTQEELEAAMKENAPPPPQNTDSEEQVSSLIQSILDSYLQTSEQENNLLTDVTA